MTLFADAMTEAVRWAVPVALTALLGWWAIKRKAIAEWREQRAERRDRFDAMLADFPQLRDSVTDLKNNAGTFAGQIKRVEARLNAQDNVLDSISAQLWAAARFDVQARFQCDSAGHNIAVNAAYASMLRVSEFALGDLRWKNCIDEADADRYLSLVDRHFREHRRFEGDVVFKRGDGTRFRGRVRIEPHPEDAADLAEGRIPVWFGSVLLVEEIAG